MSEAEAQRLDELEAVRLRLGDGAIDGSWKVQSPASISLAIVKDRLDTGRKLCRRVVPGFVGGGRVEITVAAQLVEAGEVTVEVNRGSGNYELDFEPTVGHAGQWVVGGDGDGNWEVSIAMKLVRRGADVTEGEDMAMMMLAAGIVEPVSYWGTTKRTAVWSGKGAVRRKVGKSRGDAGSELVAEPGATGADAASGCCEQSEVAELTMLAGEGWEEELERLLSEQQVSEAETVVVAPEDLPTRSHAAVKKAVKKVRRQAVKRLQQAWRSYRLRMRVGRWAQLTVELPALGVAKALWRWRAGARRRQARAADRVSLVPTVDAAAARVQAAVRGWLARAASRYVWMRRWGGVCAEDRRIASDAWVLWLEGIAQ